MFTPPAAYDKVCVKNDNQNTHIIKIYDNLVEEKFVKVTFWSLKR